VDHDTHFAAALAGAPHAPAQSPSPSPGAPPLPPINEDDFDQESWDKWYREQIRLSIEDPRPSVPHEDVVDWMERKLQAMRNRHAQTCDA